MRKIIYYVACSLDGFIAGKNGDVSQFIYEGNGVEKYQNDLKEFDTVIMGRTTYECGYQYGLKEGQRAYPNMEHYIFSDNLKFKNTDGNVHVRKFFVEEIEKIQKQEGSDIYLCGGGQFAGWLLQNEKIDTLKIKLNPILCGTGISLFGDSQVPYQLELLESESYEKGVQIMTYKILY